MKKILALAMSAFVFLVACGKTLPEATGEVDEWRKAYAERLDKGDICGFYIGKINDSDFPVLITWSDNGSRDIALETNSGYVYAFADGELKALELQVVSAWGKVGYLKETNQIILLQWYGHTTGTFGSVDFFLYDWTSNGYIETRSVMRESGYCDEYDADTEDYLVKRYGQGYINGEEVDFEEFEIALSQMYALLEKSTWFPMTDANDEGNYLDYLINWKPN